MSAATLEATPKATVLAISELERLALLHLTAREIEADVLSRLALLKTANTPSTPSNRWI